MTEEQLAQQLQHAFGGNRQQAPTPTPSLYEILTRQAPEPTPIAAPGKKVDSLEIPPQIPGNPVIKPF